MAEWIHVYDAEWESVGCMTRKLAEFTESLSYLEMWPNAKHCLVDRKIQ